MKGIILLILVIIGGYFYNKKYDVSNRHKIYFGLSCAGFVLFLYTSAGQLLEFTPRDSLSECLSIKRKIERTDPPPRGKERWVCKKGKLKIKTMNGKKYPVEVLDY